MTDSSAAGLISQQKILDLIEALTVEINQVKVIANSVMDEKEKTRQIVGSLQYLIQLSELIETESKYFFELSYCQRLMMTDNLHYVRKLEQELRELRP